MTTNNKHELAFPVGYHEFHKDPALNFNLIAGIPWDMQGLKICKQPVKRLNLLKNGK